MAMPSNLTRLSSQESLAVYHSGFVDQSRAIHVTSASSVESHGTVCGYAIYNFQLCCASLIKSEAMVCAVLKPSRL